VSTGDLARSHEPARRRCRRPGGGTRCGRGCPSRPDRRARGRPARLISSTGAPITDDGRGAVTPSLASPIRDVLQVGLGALDRVLLEADRRAPVSGGDDHGRSGPSWGGQLDDVEQHQRAAVQPGLVARDRGRVVGRGGESRAAPGSSSRSWRELARFSWRDRRPGPGQTDISSMRWIGPQRAGRGPARGRRRAAGEVAPARGTSFSSVFALQCTGTGCRSSSRPRAGAGDQRLCPGAAARILLQDAGLGRDDGTPCLRAWPWRDRSGRWSTRCGAAWRRMPSWHSGWGDHLGLGVLPPSARAAGASLNGLVDHAGAPAQHTRVRPRRLPGDERRRGGDPGAKHDLLVARAPLTILTAFDDVQITSDSALHLGAAVDVAGTTVWPGVALQPAAQNTGAGQPVGEASHPAREGRARRRSCPGSGSSRSSAMKWTPQNAMTSASVFAGPPGDSWSESPTWSGEVLQLVLLVVVSEDHRVAPRALSRRISASSSSEVMAEIGIGPPGCRRSRREPRTGKVTFHGRVLPTLRVYRGHQMGPPVRWRPPPPETSQAIATCVDNGARHESGAGVADSRCCVGRHRAPRWCSALLWPRAMKKVPFKKAGSHGRDDPET